MSVIITMAGAGSRFAREGFTVPKYRVRARGRTLFEWSMASLDAFRHHRCVFACLEGQDVQWIRETAARLGFDDVAVVTRAALSRGQAHTALDALDPVASEDPLWIYNIDTCIEAGVHPDDIAGYQGCLHVFESSSPAMSYVRYDSQGDVAEIAEKVVISNWATAGVYGFESARLFRALYQQTYGQPRPGAPAASEHYVAPLYQTLLQAGGRIRAPRLALSAVHVLGTPDEVRQFDPAVRPPAGSSHQDTP